MEITEINITLPVFNEEIQLPLSLARVLDFLQEHLPSPCEIVIANNASTDRTLEVARELCRRMLPRNRLLHLADKGAHRGQASVRKSRADAIIAVSPFPRRKTPFRRAEGPQYDSPGQSASACAALGSSPGASSKALKGRHKLKPFFEQWQLKKSNRSPRLRLARLFPHLSCAWPLAKRSINFCS